MNARITICNDQELLKRKYIVGRLLATRPTRQDELIHKHKAFKVAHVDNQHTTVFTAQINGVSNLRDCPNDITDIFFLNDPEISIVRNINNTQTFRITSDVCKITINHDMLIW